MLIGDHREVVLPAELPKGWFDVTEELAQSPEQARYQKHYRRRDRLLVIVDISRKIDGRFWRHVSFSYRDRTPDYCTITDMKRLFVGENRKAVMIFPAKSLHVNLHEHCLHLWACEDDEGFVPEMSDILAGVGRSI
jgi:hypothetical protein